MESVLRAPRVPHREEVQEQATSTGKAEARADLTAGQAAAGRANADLHGELAEVRAENERLRKLMQDLEAENLQRRQKRSRPELLRGATQMMFGGMQETLSGACPDCGSQLEYAEGCVKCHVCGYSECG